MKNASHYRALALLYRQQAAHDPDRNWQLLGQAERWEHLAAQALADDIGEPTAANDRTWDEVASGAQGSLFESAA